MKKLRELQLNKGVSLVEVLVAIGVSSIVMVVIFAFISSGSNFFKRQSNSIDLQNELQEASNKVSDTLMEATNLIIRKNGDDIYIYTGGEYDQIEDKVVFDKNAKVKPKLIYWSSTTNSLYVFDTLDGIDTSGDEELNKIDRAYCMSEYVSAIRIKPNSNCEIVNNSITGVTGYTQPLMIDIEIEVSNKGEERHDEKTVTLRNSIDTFIYYSKIYKVQNDGTLK